MRREILLKRYLYGVGSHYLLFTIIITMMESSRTSFAIARKPAGCFLIMFLNIIQAGFLPCYLCPPDQQTTSAGFMYMMPMVLKQVKPVMIKKDRWLLKSDTVIVSINPTVICQPCLPAG